MWCIWYFPLIHYSLGIAPKYSDAIKRHREYLRALYIYIKKGVGRGKWKKINYAPPAAPSTLYKVRTYTDSIGGLQDDSSCVDCGVGFHLPRGSVGKITHGSRILVRAFQDLTMEVSETDSWTRAGKLGLSALAWIIRDLQNLNWLENLSALAKVQDRKYRYTLKNKSETSKIQLRCKLWRDELVARHGWWDEAGRFINPLCSGFYFPASFLPHL